MKRTSFILLVAFCALSQTLHAQTADRRVFNHMAIGLSLGTDGIGFDVAMPATEFFDLRVGASFLPKLKFSGDYDIDSESASITADEVTIEGKINKMDAKALLDFYPVKNGIFRITAGAYIGGSKVLSAYNTSEFLAREDWGNTGVKIGDYRVMSDEQGNVKADIKVNAIKPYLGIGIGRAVPRNKRIGVMADLGVQFWGKPSVWANAKDDFGDIHYTKLEKQDFSKDQNNSADANKAIDIMEKICVYPVLSIRICGRIF
ncbi:MAG: hypothetical protein IJ209_05565 [Bacteroidaceae bacterium]|nr:hypothetical protein [Bacteroidaceae bacterium]